ncbi:MAG: hypothetical protein WCD79_18020, partial [Chthoniobacteraceae bacterium]
MKAPLLLICVVLFATIPVIASDGICDIQWCADANILSDWKNLDGGCSITSNERSPATHTELDSSQFAVCSADFTKSLFLSDPDENKLTIGSFRGFLPWLSPESIKKLDALGDGIFHAAYFINGKRCSNILTLTIDHTHSSFDGPSLHLDAMPDAHATSITLVAAWFVQGDRQDINARYSSLICPKLVIDGARTEIPMGVWRGANRILAPHQPQGALIDLEDCRPAVK